MYRKKVCMFFAAGLFSAASMLASVALAQPPQEESTDAAASAQPPQKEENADAVKDEVEHITVTGSRIRQTNLTSSSPVTQVNADEFLYKGITRVEDLLNDLPQVTAANTSGDANGATGTATIDLRGLGDVRTLTLLNGRRLPYGSPAAGGVAPDVNQIPGILIERVEVLTGGASSVYGSDAVAGVVNFITKQDFSGFMLDYQNSFYQHQNNNSVSEAVTASNFTLPDSSVSDGKTNDISLLLGMNSADGNGNVTAYVTYRDIAAVLQSQRDYSACALADGPDSEEGRFTCGGSSTIPAGRFTDFGVLDPNSFDYLVEGNQFVNRAGNSGALFNYGPLNYFQRPDKRTTFGAMGHYEFSKKAVFYTELNFMDDKSVAQIAPSGDFFDTSELNCGNPLLSAQQFNLLCGNFGLGTGDTQTVFIGRRNVEGGPRQDNLQYTAYRSVFGLRGDFGSAWSYDVFANFGKVNFSQLFRNDVSVTRMGRALNVVADPNSGAPVCQSVLDGSDPNCVPWNVFQTGGVTQAALDYISLPLFAKGSTSQAQIVGYVTGDLADHGMVFPGAKSGIKVVGGYEYRKDKLIFEPDQGFQSGDGSGQGGPIQGVEGQYDVKELFGELSLPILEDSSIAELLKVDIGYRHSDYSTDKKTNTYKIAADWRVNSTIGFRASFQRAIRAGNLRELFRPATIGLFDMESDPCSGATPDATVEQCARTGVTLSQYGNIADSPAGQFNEITGGNTALDPEKSETASFGVLLNFDNQLTLTADYYSIKVDEAIDNVDSTFTLDQCLATGNSLYCDKIHRGSQTGSLWIGDDHIRSTDINIGFFKTSGLDIALDYELGAIKLSAVATLLNSWDQQNVPNGPTTDCLGHWGKSCGAPTPKWNHTLRATWITPWDGVITAAWRYIDGVDDLGANGADFSSRGYLDVATIWKLSDGVDLRFGINNLLDKDPPLTSDAGPSIFGNGNTFPGRYDALGRYIFTGLSFKY